MVFDALYNSSRREEEHASTCQPGTRTRIIQIILDWANGAGHPVCWLRGPAGTGKSTIAHTTADELSALLAASFFFGRKKGAREDITKLVPTLAYQIAQNIPSTELKMREALENDKTIPFQRLRDQFSSLLVGSVAELGHVPRHVVVVDGLDECTSRDGVLEFIRLLAEAIDTLPFRFLLTSRPEPDIEAAFRLHMTDRMALWLALEDSREDVRKYLKTHLQQTRDKLSRIMQDQPKLWPSEQDLESLVTKSDGLFIYAATAARYIGDGTGSPQKKLRRVLEVHHGVDELYAQVISDAQECEHFDTVMGSLMYLAEPLPINILSKLLGIDVDDIRVALDRCHSILAIPDNYRGSIRPYHASSQEFLTSEERSKNLYFIPSRYHCMLAVGCIQDITNAWSSNSDPLKYACDQWGYHTSFVVSGPGTKESLSSQLHGAAEQIDLMWVEYWLGRALLDTPRLQFEILMPSAVSDNTEVGDVLNTH